MGAQAAGGPPPERRNKRGCELSSIELWSREDDHTPLPVDAPGLMVPKAPQTEAMGFDEMDLPEDFGPERDELLEQWRRIRDLDPAVVIPGHNPPVELA